jgi:hypothetical protein
MTLNSRSAKLSSPNVKVQDVPNVPTIGTPTQGINDVLVPFTPATRGGNAAVYRAVSNPGGIEATSFGSSPITVSGLNGGTAYTFSVRGETSTGATTGYSSSSPSITTDFGAYQQIATTIVSGTQTLVTFSNIPQNYKHLQVRVAARGNEATVANMIYSRMNGDFSSLYSSHRLYGDGAGVGSDAYTSGSNAWTAWLPNANAGSNQFGSMVFDLLDYNSTSKNKTFRAMSGSVNGSSNHVFMVSGAYRNTNAITSLEFFPNSGSFIAGSRFSLYGIRG